MCGPCMNAFNLQFPRSHKWKQQLCNSSHSPANSTFRSLSTDFTTTVWVSWELGRSKTGQNPQRRANDRKIGEAIRNLVMSWHSVPKATVGIVSGPNTSTLFGTWSGHPYVLSACCLFGCTFCLKTAGPCAPFLTFPVVRKEGLCC